MTAEPVVPASLFNQVAQLAHVAAGLAALFGSLILFKPDSMWPVLITFAAITGMKEFWYDQHFETPIVRGSNLEDWTFYQVGSVTAALATLGVTWLRGHV